MKTTTIAASAIVALLLTGVAAVAFASSGPALSNIRLASPNAHPDNQGQQGTTHQDNESDSGTAHEGGSRLACSNLTVGETLSVSGLEGRFQNATNHEIQGNATGSFTFKVTQIYAQGCTLSITSGSLKLGSTTYTVTGGAMILNEGGRSGQGTGTTSGGSFLIRVDGLRGSSSSAGVGSIGLDLKQGASEFLVHLGAPEAED